MPWPLGDILVASVGIEPTFSASKARVLPLDDKAILVQGTEVESVSFPYEGNDLPSVPP